MRLAIAGAALCLLAATPAAAAPGAPDQSFGTRGYVHARFGPTDSAASLHRRADGKLLVAGQVTGVRDRNGRDGATFLVARYLRNGRLDTSFGTGGTVRTWFGRYSGAAKLIELSDGRLLVVGDTIATYGRDPVGVAMARYRSNGSLDKTFSGDGRLFVPVLGYEVNVTDAERRPDGRIVVVGGLTGQQDQPFILQLHADGRVDRSFGNGGVVIPSFTGGASAAVGSVEVLPDKSLVVLGYHGAYPFLARFLPNGVHDAEFGITGAAVPTMQNANLGALRRLPDGSFLAAGHRSVASVRDVTPSHVASVVRFTPEGDHDLTFGIAGWASFGDGKGYQSLLGLTTMRDGRIVAVGQIWRQTSDVLLVRLTADGMADESFGDGGTVVTGNATRHDALTRVVLEPDGRFTALGLSWTSQAGQSTHTMLARYLG